jgi:hypothetical protein
MPATSKNRSTDANDEPPNFSTLIFFSFKKRKKARDLGGHGPFLRQYAADLLPRRAGGNNNGGGIEMCIFHTAHMLKVLDVCQSKCVELIVFLSFKLHFLPFNGKSDPWPMLAPNQYQFTFF